MTAELSALRTRLNALEADQEVADALLEGVLDLYSLSKVGRILSAALDLDELLSTAVQRAADAARIESFSLFLLDRAGKTLVAKSVGGPAAQSLRQMTLDRGEGLAGRVYGTRTPEAHAGDSTLRWPDTPLSVRSVFAFPLIGRDGFLGALLMYSASPAGFVNPARRAYLGAVGTQLSIALDNALLHGRATEMSYRDTLTGLYNRRYLEEALETEVRRAARYCLPLSLIMVDIDYFKAYNDTYGHGRGDELLGLVAQRLSEATRSADIVTRYGGEEFAAILPMTTKPHALLFAEKLRLAIAALPVEGPEDRRDGGLTISVGVAAFPEDATTAGALLQAADAALYEAKARGRNRVEIFTARTPSPVETPAHRSR